MRIYLAARFNRNIEMREVRKILQENGHVVTSRWIDLATERRALQDLNSRPTDFSHFARDDVSDIINSDMVLSFTSEDGVGKGGRHIEFGLAYAYGKQLAIIGPRENVFHTLPRVQVFKSISEFLKVFPASVHQPKIPHNH